MDKKFAIIQLSESDKKDVLSMREQGYTLREIAEYIGCSVNAVAYHLRLAGLQNYNRWTNELDQELIRYYNKGLKSSEIAQLINRPQNNIEHRVSYLRKLNVSILYHRKRA